MSGTEGGPLQVSRASGQSSLRMLQVLGLAVRARQVALGSDAVLKSIQTGRAKLVLLASDAGANGSKKYRDKCAFYKVPLVYGPERNLLGSACGKPNMVSVSVLDEGFAVRLIELAREINGGEAFGETSGV